MTSVGGPPEIDEPKSDRFGKRWAPGRVREFRLLEAENGRIQYVTYQTQDDAAFTSFEQ